MRALVIGASGFIGYHVARRLVNLGDEVVGMIRPTSETSPLEALGLELRRADLTQPDTLSSAIRDVEVVYHCAGVLRTAAPERLRRVNEGGVANALAVAARLDPAPTYVLLSSIAAAGPSPEDRPLVEADPPAPVSDYGRSKLAGEQAARAFAGQVPISIVRPPVVFGPRDRETLEYFRMADRSWHVIPGSPDRRFSLIHAADLAHLLVRVADGGERLPGDGGPPGEGLYYAGDDDRPTFAELGQRIAGALGRDLPLRVIPTPQAVSWGVAAFAELSARMRGKKPVVNRDALRDAGAGSWMCSDAKARAQLGMKMPVPLDERLRETAEWYREAGWLGG